MHYFSFVITVYYQSDKTSRSTADVIIPFLSAVKHVNYGYVAFPFVSTFWTWFRKRQSVGFKHRMVTWDSETSPNS